MLVYKLCCVDDLIYVRFFGINQLVHTSGIRVTRFHALWKAFSLYDIQILQADQIASRKKKKLIHGSPCAMHGKPSRFPKE